MQGNTRWLLLFVAWLLGLWCAVGLSQPPGGATEPEQPAPLSEGNVVKAPLEVILGILGDDSEQLVPFSDLTLEAFERLDELYDLKMSRELPAPPPAYSVESVLASGVAKQGLAELSIVFDIVVSSEYGARVPLGLPKAKLVEAVEYQGPGDLFRMVRDEVSGAYVAYLRGGKAQAHHQLTLEVLVRIDSLGADFRMRLSMPEANLSELKLRVPLADARAEISGRPEEAVAATAAPGEEGSTLFTIQGLEWDQEIVWRQADNRGVRLPPVLSVEGEVVAKIDDRKVETKATLTVDANGELFDRFRVRLPRFATLRAHEPAEYEVTLVEAGESETNGGRPEDGPAADPDHPQPGDGPVFEVQFPVEKMAKVTLTVRQVHQPSQAGEFFELGRFEVLGALEQRGRIRVGADDVWQIVWGPDDGVRRFNVDEDLSEELLNVVGVFRYLRQPCSLQAKAVPRRTWISLEPKYYLSVSRGRVELKADLHYTIHGSALENENFHLNVVLPGWICDRIEESDELIDMSEVEAGSSGLISIPLTPPARGEASITILAHRDIDDSSAGLLSFSLPRPEADFVGSALVEIQPDPNVELVPRFKDIVGLYRPREAPVSRGPANGQRDPQIYYVSDPQAVFAADVSFHKQSISVNVVSTADLLADTPTVTQTLTYDVHYEPVDELILAVPVSLAESLVASGDELSVFLGDRRLNLENKQKESGLTESDPASGAGGNSAAASGTVEAADPATESRSNAPPPHPSETPTVLKRVILPTQLFSCELTIRYPIDRIPIQPRQSVKYSIPLVMPADGRLEGNDLHVQTSAEVKIGLDKAIGLDLWSALTPASKRFLRHNELHLTSSQRLGGVPLLAHEIDRDLLGSTLIEQAWIQTWLTEDRRRDRAVFRFTSDREHLVLWLPEGIDLGGVKVSLDGTSREPEPMSRDRLSVKLTPDPENRPHLLEIIYHGPRRAGRGQMSLELPRVGDGVWTRRTYWQLILPRDEHVVVEPTNCTPEFHWGWNGMFWGRVPTMGQSDLEGLITADERDSLPNQTSRYLFSSLGPIERVDLRTADRTKIFLAGSGVVLLVGLGLIYFQAVRRPAVVFVLAVAICAAAAIHPTSALLLAQAASVGLALALLAGLLHRALSRHGRRPVRQEAFSSILDRGSTETQLHSPLPGSSVSTDTAPAAAPPSKPEPR